MTQVKVEKYYHQNIVKVATVKVVIVQIGPFQNNMICFIIIVHESVLKAGKGAASLNDFLYCRVACEFTPGGTKV